MATANDNSSLGLYRFETCRQSFMSVLKNLFKNEQSIDGLCEVFNQQSGSAVDKKNALEQAFKDILTHIMEKPKSSDYEKVLELAIDACNKEICNATLPVLLLNDMFDVNTIENCEKLFIFVENHVDTWKQTLFFNSSKNSLLRMCNDLLRRLSRSQNTVFCGRILLFLAKYFPLSERSGLNVASEFNLENTTLFGTEDNLAVINSFSNMNDDPSDDTISEPPEKMIRVDYNLYRKFWTLQDFFRNPNQCYNKISWRTFTAHSDEVLNTFSSFKLDDVTISKSRLEQQSDKGKKQPVYFAKYLTNSELLDLQLSDSNFRRYVLIQFLIQFQYLNSGVKFKLDTYQISEEQSNWIKSATERINNLLEETPPDGATFVRAINHILKREEFWSTWKNDGCPEIGQLATVTENVAEKTAKPVRQKRSAGEELRAASSREKYLLGNPSLTKLWNLCPDNMAACRSQKRDFLPSMETFFEEAIIQADPANMVEENYKLVHNSNYGWRALRLLACRSPHFFTPSNQPINKLPLYLETMIKKVAKEMPQQTSEPDKGLIENGGEESDDELLKNTEDQEESCTSEKYENSNGTNGEEELNNTNSISAVVTPEQVILLSEGLGDDWKKLASTLGFEKDEIEYFENDCKSAKEQALKMLTVWKENNEELETPNVLITALKSVGYEELANKVFQQS